VTARECFRFQYGSKGKFLDELETILDDNRSAKDGPFRGEGPTTA